MIKTNFKVTRTRLITIKKIDYTEVLAENKDMALVDAVKMDRAYRGGRECENACDVNPGNCNDRLLTVDESFEIEEVK